MKLHIYKTNRRIKESPYLTACKEQDGLLGNIEMNHYTNVDEMVVASVFTVDPGSNLKRQRGWVSKPDWFGIADELNKPGMFDKLVRYFKK